MRNVLIRRNYRPTHAAPDDPADAFAADARAGRLTADELLSRYVTLVYSRTASYEETARRLGLDRRTVKAKVNEEMLTRLKSPPPRARSCTAFAAQSHPEPRT